MSLIERSARTKHGYPSRLVTSRIHRLPLSGARVVGVGRLRFKSRSTITDLHGSAAGLGTRRAHTAGDGSAASAAVTAAAGCCRTATYDTADAGAAANAANPGGAAVDD
jgi:hypothetical protein